MSKCEQAAAMRNAGKTVADIAVHFGWSIKTTKELISRGRNYDAFKAKHRRYQKRKHAEARAA